MSLSALQRAIEHPDVRGTEKVILIILAADIGYQDTPTRTTIKRVATLAGVSYGHAAKTIRVLAALDLIGLSAAPRGSIAYWIHG